MEVEVMLDVTKDDDGHKDYGGYMREGNVERSNRERSTKTCAKFWRTYLGCLANLGKLIKNATLIACINTTVACITAVWTSYF